MNKRILVLNTEFSGMNKYLFAQLRKHGWDLLICDVPVPKCLRYWAMLTTFRFSMRDWRKKFARKLNKFYKSSWCFKWRSNYCAKLIKKYGEKIDLVFQISGMFAPSLKEINIPYVVYTDYTMRLAEKYDEWSSPKEEIEKWISLETELYQRASLNFACCENTRQSIINDYGAGEQCALNIGFGVSFDHIDNVDQLSDNKMILFVGFDFKRKGGFVLLDAFKDVRKKMPDARLVIIGPSKKIYHIEQAGVEFLGPVSDREKVKQYFREASVFAMPSFCEPFGLVFLEAMAHKLPCIGSRVDAMPEIIQDGETGCLVDPDNADQLADCLIRVLSDKDMAERMGILGYERLNDHFNWEKVGECVNNALSEINN